MTPPPPRGHTHQIEHFCSKQQKVGIQGGECADPENCPLTRAVELLRRFVEALAETEEVEEVPVPEGTLLDTRTFLASLESKQAAEENPRQG